MKNLLLIFVFFLFCGSQISDSTKADINFIKSFYKVYNEEATQNPGPKSVSNRDAILKAFCTPRLISFLNKQFKNGLDYDPFLNGQDADPETTKTLRVKEENSPHNLYSVSYIWAPTGETVDGIGLIIITEKGSRKIDFVYLDPNEDKKYKDVKLKQ